MNITTLAQLISATESNDNPIAVRFEPHHVPFTRYINSMKAIAKVSTDTAAVLCAMSWGKYQIMGDTLLDMGLTVSPLEFIQDDDLQDTYFARFLERKRISYIDLKTLLGDKEMRERFARVYNGPGNIAAYSQRLVQVANAHGLVTV